MCWKDVLTIFAFMNWTLAQGVWSNLQNSQIRRDLQIELKDSLLTKLAKQFTRSDNLVDIAAKAASVTEDFNVYLIGYNRHVQTLGGADSNAARLFALQQIQDECGIEDAVMNEIVPSIWSDTNANSEVELVAMQVNNAVAEMKSKGFLRRLFGSR